MVRLVVAVGIEPFLGIPTPFPTWGGVLTSTNPFICKGSLAFSRRSRIPDFGRFCRMCGYRAARGNAVLAQNLPRRSRDPNGFTHGRVRNFSVKNIFFTAPLGASDVS